MKKTLLALTTLIILTGCVSQSDIDEAIAEIKDTNMTNDINETNITVSDFNMTAYMKQSRCALNDNAVDAHGGVAYGKCVLPKHDEVDFNSFIYAQYREDRFYDYGVTVPRELSTMYELPFTMAIPKNDTSEEVRHGFQLIYMSYPEITGEGYVVVQSPLEDPNIYITMDMNTSFILDSNGTVLYVDRNVTTNRVKPNDT